MPTAAPKPCTVCATLVRDGSSRCTAHKPLPWLARADVKRQAGRALQRKRAALFARNPLCEVCLAEGRTTLATIRDHIVPLAEGGADDDRNTQGLCTDCHATKTKAESIRGRGAKKSTTSPSETDLAGAFSCARVLVGGG